MWRVVVLLLMALMALMGSGCDCDTSGAVSDCLVDPQRSSARISFFNYLTDEGGGRLIQVDLEAGTESSALVRSRDYSGSDTPGDRRLEFADDVADVAFTVRPAGGSGAAYVSGQTVELEDGDRFTFVVMGDVGDSNGFVLGAYRRDASAPPADAVSLRFINTLSRIETSPQDLDVRVNGRTEATNLAVGDTSGFRTLTPTDGRIDVDLRDSTEEVVASPGCDVTAGERYEAILAYDSPTRTNDNDIRLFCHEL